MATRSALRGVDSPGGNSQQSNRVTLTTVTSQPMLRLRPAVARDALRLSVLATQVFLDTYATGGIRESIAHEVTELLSVDAFSAILGDPRSAIVLAECDDHTIGFVHVTSGAAPERVDDPAAEIVRLYVQQPFVDRGIGSDLLARAEHLAAVSGASSAWLTAWSGNQRALAFYARRGYADRGSTIHELQGERHENRLFVKAINRPSS